MRITVFSLLALMRPRCYWLYNSHEPGPPHVVVTLYNCHHPGWNFVYNCRQSSHVVVTLYNCHHPDLSTGSAGSCAGFSIPTTRSRACQAASSIPKLVAQCNPTPAHAAHAAASSPRCASAIIRLSTAATRYRGPPTGGGIFRVTPQSPHR